MYFYIYVHLDKAKIATLARLKASFDVIKRDRSRCLNVERNITMRKTARCRSRVRQPKSFTCIKFHSATTRRGENNYGGSWKNNWMLFCRLATTQNHQRNAHVHLKKCQNKLDCLIFEMLFIKELKPSLNKQCDSIRAKLFV